MEELQGRRYLVSGASSDIGRAVSRKLLEHGARVVGLSRRDASIPVLDELPDRFAPRFEAVMCDVTEVENLVASISRVLDGGPVLDGAVLCHGYGDFGNLEEFSNARISQMFCVNLASYKMICRQLVPFLKARKSGDIVFVGSESGLRAGKKGAVYSASKFGLQGLARALRDECAASGVRISIINPGLVQTAFFDSLDFEPGEHRDNYLLPEDVAAAVCLALGLPRGSVIDEINLSPQKKVIRNTQK